MEERSEVVLKLGEMPDRRQAIVVRVKDGVESISNVPKLAGYWRKLLQEAKEKGQLKYDSYELRPAPKGLIDSFGVGRQTYKEETMTEEETQQTQTTEEKDPSASHVAAPKASKKKAAAPKAKAKKANGYTDRAKLKPIFDSLVSKAGDLDALAKKAGLDPVHCRGRLISDGKGLKGRWTLEDLEDGRVRIVPKG